MATLTHKNDDCMGPWKTVQTKNTTWLVCTRCRQAVLATLEACYWAEDENWWHGFLNEMADEGEKLLGREG